MKLDLKLYRGYASDDQLNVYGHLFKSWAPDKYRIDRKGLKHAFAILHMFRIRPLKNFEVTFEFQGVTATTKTLDDGYFEFNIPYTESLKSGWHTYQVSCRIKEIGIVEKAEFLKPYPSEYGVISDIDDTFLISHSNSFFKKLYVMLSKNINKRKIFDDVVEHYKALSHAGQASDEASNSFFYVSSSEWNLYAFINAFAQLHELPKAVIKLKKIKTGISDFLLTGRGQHDHKFDEIKKIISFYPEITYVLLGDDSQKDPFIYERVCKIFPNTVKAIYIRQTGKKHKTDVKTTLETIESLGVHTCYFKDSSEAIKHSYDINIIS